jgi:hypothetical protein
MSQDRALRSRRCALSRRWRSFVETARAYAADSRASSTRRAYLSDFTLFQRLDDAIAGRNFAWDQIAADPEPRGNKR